MSSATNPHLGISSPSESAGSSKGLQSSATCATICLSASADRSSAEQPSASLFRPFGRTLTGTRHHKPALAQLLTEEASPALMVRPAEREAPAIAGPESCKSDGWQPQIKPGPSDSEKVDALCAVAVFWSAARIFVAFCRCAE